MIGSLGITIPPETSVATIGYCLSSSHWGKGYLPEALLALLESYWKLYPTGLPGSLLEDEEGSCPVDSWVDEKNLGSVRVMEKCGFKIIGEDVIDDWYGEGEVVLKRYRIRKPKE